MTMNNKATVWFVYVGTKANPDKFIYHSETTLGEAEANLIAARLIENGSRVFLTNKYVSDCFINSTYSHAR